MVFVSPAIDVLVFSFFIILVINIFYKLLIDQQQAKQARDRMKEINETIKEEQKKGNTERVNKLLGELMSENSRIMRMSLKPMIVSFVIILLALPWIGDIYGDRSVKLQNGTGELNVDGNVYAVQKTESGVQVNGASYDTPANGADLAGSKWNIAVDGNEVKLSRVVAQLPFALPFVGDDMGWLGWYFLSALLFMVVTRKFLKVYV